MNKQQLIQEIKDMRNKLASMEKELNKHEEHIQFPRTGDNYFFYLPNGSIEDCYATNDRIKPNAYKTREEAREAHKKAVAIEKIKRRILELQGDWKPDWLDEDEEKHCIQYDHDKKIFIPIYWYRTQQDLSFPYIKNEEITNIIINEFNNELKLVFEIK